MTKKEREEILREIDFLLDDIWSGAATVKNIGEEQMEKMDLLWTHLRILRDELRGKNGEKET